MPTHCQSRLIELLLLLLLPAVYKDARDTYTKTGDDKRLSFHSDQVCPSAMAAGSLIVPHKAEFFHQ
jgi:hypothetical protein